MKQKNDSRLISTGMSRMVKRAVGKDKGVKFDTSRDRKPVQSEKERGSK